MKERNQPKNGFVRNKVFLCNLIIHFQFEKFNNIVIWTQICVFDFDFDATQSVGSVDHDSYS